MIGSWSVRAAAFALACVAFTLSAPAAGVAQGTPRTAAMDHPLAAREVSSALIAQQLGVKLSPNQPEELAMGTSLTGMLVEPGRLAAFGLSDAHEGARVSVLRSAQERVRVDVDELEPAPRSRTLALRLSADGKLGAPAR